MQLGEDAQNNQLPPSVGERRGGGQRCGTATLAAGKADEGDARRGCG
jgi:hypothetical protein